MSSKYWRPLLFFFFVAAFLVSAPLVVLYTAGYRYHLESGKIVQTGVVNLSSIPKGATIFLDDIKQTEHTPAVISDVLPGAHVIRFEKSEYSSWEKTLEVQSRKSTFATEVVLFLQQEPELLDDEIPLLKTASLKTTDRKRMIQNTTDRTVISEINQENIATILAYLPLSTYEFVEAPDPFILVHDLDRHRLTLLDPRNHAQPILLSNEAIQWAWSPDANALLFSDGFEIEVYFPHSHSRETVTRFSQMISGLTWYPQGNVAVFISEADVVAQELDRRGEPNKTTLVSGLNVSRFWFEEEGKWLVGVANTKEGEKMFRKKLQK